MTHDVGGQEVGVIRDDDGRHRLEGVSVVDHRGGQRLADTGEQGEVASSVVGTEP